MSTRDSLTCHVENAVTGSNMGQEGVPQALAGMGSPHQARDVHHIEESWDLAANMEVKTIKSSFKTSAAESVCSLIKSIQTLHPKIFKN